MVFTGVTDIELIQQALRKLFFALSSGRHGDCFVRADFGAKRAANTYLFTHQTAYLNIAFAGHLQTIFRAVIDAVCASGAIVFVDDRAGTLDNFEFRYDSVELIGDTTYRTNVAAHATINAFFINDDVHCFLVTHDGFGRALGGACRAADAGFMNVVWHVILLISL